VFQKAELLGFATHAAFVLDMRMSKTPERVKDFLSDLEKRLQTLKHQELELFLTYKKEDVRLFCVFAVLIIKAVPGSEYDGLRSHANVLSFAFIQPSFPSFSSPPFHHTFFLSLSSAWFHLGV
jgi:Peptidase family M3